MFENENILDYLVNKVAEAILVKKEDANASVVSDTTQFYTVDELCKILRISKATYYRHRDMGFVVPAKYIGRKPLFTQQSIDNYLANFQKG